MSSDLRKGSPEYVRAKNHQFFLERRAKRRADPSHPCHKWPDEMIHECCENWVQKRRTEGKTTASREDIFCEVTCPGESRGGFYRNIGGGDRTYIKHMITYYMNTRYPIMEVRRHTKIWDISGGEPCSAISATCPTTD